MDTLFHAYIVGGGRDIAMARVAEMLAPHGSFTSANPDYLFCEYVSFAVDDARSLRAWQELSPVGERKVCLICTDFMTPEAQNALLKTFEEPVPNTHLFFIVPKPDILLPTFLSRVQQVRVESANGGVAEAESFLRMTIGERMAYIQKLVAKSDDEDASSEVREKAIGFLESIERLYSQNLNAVGSSQTAKKIETLLTFKRYMYTPGASVRALLETIALTF